MKKFLPFAFACIATLTTLTGTPRQTSLQPSTTEINLTGEITVPPYSFTVIRIY